MLAQNKKAFAEFEILEKFEAGIVLTGGEVKSVRGGHANLKGSHVEVSDKDEAWVRGVHISPYKPAQQSDYNPTARRKLLLNKKEILQIKVELDTKGIAAVPLDLHLRGNHIKITVGLCRGKKKHDRRDELKKKAQNLDIKRALKKY